MNWVSGWMVGLGGWMDGRIDLVGQMGGWEDARIDFGKRVGRWEN